MNKKLAIILAAGSSFYGTAAWADTCTGNCGTGSPNGVVTAPPAYGPDYGYVSTSGGVNGAGQISGVGGTNGSELITDSFSAVAGDKLQFYFNYVTSDGAGFSDYSFAELLKDGASVGFLFTARTIEVGNTSPGFGLPANISTLTPATTPIVPGGPVWDKLGGDSGYCYDDGCGYTGWIGSNYTIDADGSYQLRFGVTNFQDFIVHSGLAFAGITVNDVPVNPGVPEPATWAMMILGFGVTGAAMRRRTKVNARVSLV